MKKSILPLLAALLIISLNHLYADDFWEATKGPIGKIISEVKSYPNGFMTASDYDNHSYSLDGGMNWYSFKRLASVDFLGKYGTIEFYSPAGFAFYVRNTYLYRFSLDKPGEKEIIQEDWGYGDLYFNNSGTIFCLRDSTTLKSTDNGESWQEINFIPDDIKFLTFNYADDMYYCIYDDGLYYSAGEDHKSPKKIFDGNVRSFDCTSDEILIKTGDSLLIFMDETGSKPHETILDTKKNKFYNFFIGEGNYLFANSESRCKSLYSSDKGLNWEKLEFNSYSYDDILIVNIDESGAVFANTYEGLLWKSTDNGKSWDNISGNLFGFSRDYLCSNSRYLAIPSAKTILLSSDKGETWQATANHHYDNLNYLYISQYDNLYFCSGWVGGPCIPCCSEDLGQSWYFTKSGHYSKAENHRGTVLTSNVDSLLFRNSKYGPWEYIDFSEFWPHYPGSIEFPAVTSTPNGNFYLFATYTYKSTDDCKTWNKVTEEYSGFSYDSGRLFISDKYGNLYVKTGVSNDTTSILKRSTNGGESWEEIHSNNWDESYAELLHYSRGLVSTNDGIYLATRKNIYFSSDQGDSWIKQNSGLPEGGEISSITTNPQGDIFVGLYAYPVYRHLNPNNVEEDIAEIKDISISPNPASKNISLTCNFERSGKASIQLFNATGNEVKNFGNFHLSSGENQISLDVSDFVPGAYYLKINPGNQQYSEKVIISR